MKKITKKDFYTALINLATTGELSFVDKNEDRIEITAEQLAEWSQSEIALLDRKNEKAKERAEKKRQEGDELSAAVLAAVTDELSTIADIAARVDAEDASVAKVQYRLAQLAKYGQIQKESITVPGGEGTKARTLVAYKLAD